MVSEDVHQLAGQFKTLKLHAARGGREVSRVLRAVVERSKASSTADLLEEVCENAAYLLDCLPPYAPPLNSINAMLSCVEEAARSNRDVLDTKDLLKADDTQINSAAQNAGLIADALTEILPPRARIYTHTFSETVLNTLLELRCRDRVGQVFVTESRPNNDGWDTARRLAKEGIDVSLTIDAAMPSLIGKADCMLSGAEIIHRDGSVVGKVGAFSAAALCKMSAVPVYILADTGKISPFDQAGQNFTPFKPKDLGIELIENSALKIMGAFFDQTPAEYVGAFITEKGKVLPEHIASLVPTIHVSAWLCEWLQTHPVQQ